MDSADIKLISIPCNAPGVRVALLDTEPLARRELETLRARYLSDGEQVEWATLTHPARQIEWLAARVCLKQMLVRDGLLTDPRLCELRKDSRGRPWLASADGGRLSALDVSISHQGHWACACVAVGADARVGVDIETISPRLLNVAEMFVTERDWPPLTSGPEKGVTILWTLKEAASKAIGLGIGVDLSNVICRALGRDRHEVRVDAHRALLTGWHFPYDELIIAVTLMLHGPDARGVSSVQHTCL